MSDSSLTPVDPPCSSEASTSYGLRRNSPVSDMHAIAYHSDDFVVSNIESGNIDEEPGLDSRSTLEILTISSDDQKVDFSNPMNSSALPSHKPSASPLHWPSKRKWERDWQKEQKNGEPLRRIPSSLSDTMSQNKSNLDTINVHRSREPSFEPSPNASPVLDSHPFQLAVMRAYEPLQRKRIEAGCAEAPPIDEWELRSGHSTEDEVEDQVYRKVPLRMRITTWGRPRLGFGVRDTQMLNATITSSNEQEHDSSPLLHSSLESAGSNWIKHLEENSRIAWRMRGELDSIRRKQQNTERFYVPLRPSQDVFLQENEGMSGTGELPNHHSVDKVPRSTSSDSDPRPEKASVSIKAVGSVPSLLGPQPTFRFIGVAVPWIPWLKTRMSQSRPRCPKRPREDTGDSDFVPTPPLRPTSRRKYTISLPDHPLHSASQEVSLPEQSFGPCVDELNASLVIQRLPSGNSLARLCHNCRNARPGQTLAQCGFKLLCDNGVELRCNKSWCERCLRYWYGFDDDAVMYAIHGVISATHHHGTGLGIRESDWVCAYCLSLCLCTLCSKERPVWRVPYRPSKNARLQQGALIKRRGRQPKQFIPGTQPVATLSTGQRRLRHIPPPQWLPRYDLPSASFDPASNPPTRPCTRDFPTGAPVFSAADYAPTVYQNGGSLADDGHDDSFSDTTTDVDDTNICGGASHNYGLVGQRATSRKNHLVVVPGVKLPVPAKHESLLPCVIVSEQDTSNSIPALSLEDSTALPDNISTIFLSAPDLPEIPDDIVVDADEGLDGDIACMINFSP